MSRTLFVLQGGGPTPVINATLAGIAERAAERFDQLLGFRHSFEPLTENRLYDLTSLLDNTTHAETLQRLADTPGALLGSSRKKVDEQALLSMLNVLREYRATDLIGIGGNGTMSVLNALSDFAQLEGYPLNIIGAPKTVDNDLVGVHAAPGYGSAARYVALAVRDYDCDFRAMSTFDDVTILETMGRNCGWIAAAAGLLKQTDEDAPHIILLPEQPFDEIEFLEHVSSLHTKYGRVFIVTNEMLNDQTGAIVGEAVQNGPRDSLGRAMYSLSTGTGNFLCDRIWTQLGLQARCLRPGSLSRAVSYCQSTPDRELALAVGRESVSQLMSDNTHQHMITIDEHIDFATQLLKDAAGEKPLPNNFLHGTSKYQISEAYREYALPLIGDVQPLFAGPDLGKPLKKVVFPN